MIKKRNITFFSMVALLLIALVVIVYNCRQPGAKKRGRTQKIWSIGIYTGKSPLDLAPPNSITNPVLMAKDVVDAPADFVADPFMVKEGDTWYMFFEVFNGQSKHGDIGLAVSKDGYHWTYSQIVLDMPFHLSYPYVFQWQNEYYLIPESYQADSIQLYRAEEFPTRWSLVKSLLKGYFVDSSLFYHDKKFWLFAETNPDGNDTLSLFSAQGLTEPWEEHPQSPVIKNNAHMARPAGRILVSAGYFLRFAQDDAPRYGNGVRAFEIVELTGDVYREKEIVLNPILTGSGNGWNADGMHHIDCHPLEDGSWIACVDGYRLVTQANAKKK
jgi:hypothetical protein